MAKSGISIKNFNHVIKHMAKLDLTNRKNLRETRKVMKKPFLIMAKRSRQNLKSQGSIMDGNLNRALSVGSKFKKAQGKFLVAFGARTRVAISSKRKRSLNHLHLVNSGTKGRYTKKGQYRGVVGRAKSGDKRLNTSYRRGFADKAIKPVLPTIKSIYIKGFNIIVSKIKTQGV